MEALASFIAEVGLPTSLSAMGIDATDELLRAAVAATSVRTPGCVLKLSDDDIYELLCECR